LDLKLEWFQFVCVSATIAVGILNYLPTKFAPAAVLLLFVSGIYLWESLGDMVRVTPEAAGAPLRWLLLISPVPWFAFASSRVRRQPASQFDGIWLDFRDRFGFVWAQRLREQFNRSAIHASWPVVLRWQGLRLLPGTTLPREEIQDEMLATLQSLMKRFGPKNSGHAHEH
jgi:hypothetical protein